MQTIKKQTKKTKYIGNKELLDTQTGELIPVQITEVEDRDFNFHKVWLEHLITSLSEITNQKLKLAFWIINNLDRENKLIYTQRQIAEKCGMSTQTVNKTMKILQSGEKPFLVKINIGAYMINPDIIWKGSHGSRMGIIYDYANYQAEAKKRSEEDENKTCKEV